MQKLSSVAAGIAKTAFINSELPVILSLEMHCNRKGQRKVAETLIEHLGDRLVKYDDLGSTNAARSLSPNDLRGEHCIASSALVCTSALASIHTHTYTFIPHPAGLWPALSRLCAYSVRSCPQPYNLLNLRKGTLQGQGQGGAQGDGRFAEGFAHKRGNIWK